MRTFRKTCSRCSTEFTTHKPDKQFCTQACYFASKKQDVTRPCLICGKDFTTAYRFRGNKTCSEACRRIGQSRTTSTRVTLTCEVCGKQYERPELQAIGSKHCSKECRLSTCDSRQPDVTKQCAQCGCDFTVVFYKRDQLFCSKSCAHIGENNGMFGKPGSLAGKPSWNHGQTAKTDERIAALGKKISDGTKAAFAAGERSNAGEENPNFGRTRDTRTPEQLENYSKAASKRIVDGVSGYGWGRLYGTYDAKKSPSPVKFKSSWELATMMVWDRDDTIASYEYEPTIFKIKDGRRAIPDFLVMFADGTTKFIEVKPTEMQALPDVATKLDLVRSAVERTGAQYAIIGTAEMNEFRKILGDSLDAEVSKHKRGRAAISDPPAA